MLAGSDVARASRVALGAVVALDVSSALAVQFVPAVINGYRRLMQQIGALTGELQAQGQRMDLLEEGQRAILGRLEHLDRERSRSVRAKVEGERVGV